MDHIGIDVHKRESQIYILADGGEVIEQRIRTEPERFAAVLGPRPRARMLIEASTDSEWVARCLDPPRHAYGPEERMGPGEVRGRGITAALGVGEGGQVQVGACRRPVP